jgi:hypothetical protein
MNEVLQNEQFLLKVKTVKMVACDTDNIDTVQSSLCIFHNVVKYVLTGSMTKVRLGHVKK